MDLCACSTGMLRQKMLTTTSGAPTKAHDIRHEPRACVDRQQAQRLAALLARADAAEEGPTRPGSEHSSPDHGLTRLLSDRTPTANTAGLVRAGKVGLVTEVGAKHADLGGTRPPTSPDNGALIFRSCPRLGVEADTSDEDDAPESDAAQRRPGSRASPPDVNSFEDECSLH